MIHAGPAAAQNAVDYAMAQVGKPYVYNAAGPDAFDCSGLTMAAWAAAGVRCRTTRPRSTTTARTSPRAELQPGDLIFMYHPIGHVTIYIGNGLMVSAPRPGEDVKIVTVASQLNIYVGATRLT